MKILHLTHGPFQGLPRHFLELERRFGHQADLVFFQGPADSDGFPEIPQILMDYYPIRKFRAWQVRHRVQEANRRLIAPEAADLQVRREPIAQMRPNLLQAAWRNLKDARVRRSIPGIIRDYNLDGYDVVHFDGARDLTYGAHLAAELKRRGARIVSVFYGTELRVDGVTPALDHLTDLNLTLEFDHLYLHPNIHFIPAPFEMAGEEMAAVEMAATEMPAAAPRRALHSPLRIVHAPSQRYNKGTDLILPVMDRLKARYDFEFVLVEGVTQAECRRLKAGCDLCVDQVGNRGGTGYGVSSLEMLVQGIPCVSDFTPLLAGFMPGHPFYLADPSTLESVLAGILANPAQLLERGAASRAWLEKTHGYRAVYDRLMELYAGAGISGAVTRGTGTDGDAG